MIRVEPPRLKRFGLRFRSCQKSSRDRAPCSTTYARVRNGSDCRPPQTGDSHVDVGSTAYIRGVDHAERSQTRRSFPAWLRFAGIRARDILRRTRLGIRANAKAESGTALSVLGVLATVIFGTLGIYGFVRTEHEYGLAGLIPPLVDGGLRMARTKKSTTDNKAAKRSTQETAVTSLTKETCFVMMQFREPLPGILPI